MVDFQSRDTRRGLGSDEDDDAVDEHTEDDVAGKAGIAVLATGDATTAARDAVVSALESSGYDVIGDDRRAREYDRIQSAVDDLVDRSDVSAVVTVGGTGVAPDDRTVDAVGALFSKSLPGFGEAFRRQWAEESGDPAVSSRVAAGLADDTPVFCLPDEPDAATMAARDLVAPGADAIHRTASGD